MTKRTNARTSTDYNMPEDVSGRDARWYRPEYKNKRYQPIWNLCTSLRKSQTYRHEEHLKYMRLYGGAPILGLEPRAYARKKDLYTRGRLAFNVVRNCCDAYTAKIAKERPKATFVTSGGDWALQQKAKQLDKFIEGQFYESDLYELAPQVVLDSAKIGTGLVKVFIDGEGKGQRIAVERKMPWQVLVDDEDAYYGVPTAIYEEYFIDRVVAMEMWPTKRDIIAKAGVVNEGIGEWGYEALTDQITVIEAYHLRSGPNAKDGRRCVITNVGDLEDDVYERDYLPYIPLYRQRPGFGWWGDGLAFELEGIQVEMNVLLQKVQRTHHLMGSGHWVFPKGFLNKNKLDNDVGSLWEVNGDPSQLVYHPGGSPTADVFAHIDRLYQRSYEITGIGQLSAQGQIPQGFDPKSGKALRTMSDIESERFQVAIRNYQHWYLQIARQMIDLAHEIASSNPAFSVKATSRNVMRQIVWKEVSLKDDEYVLKLYPTNALANDPSSRIAQVQEFANAGWLDKDDAMRLMDFPDLEAAQSAHNASFDLVNSMLDEMLSKGRYIGPEPFLNLQQALNLAQMAYLKAKRDMAPEDRLALLRDFMADTKALMDQNAPKPPPGPNAMPPGPGAPPGLPPGMPPPPGGPPPGTPPMPPA